jgi:hypothetical protein
MKTLARSAAIATITLMFGGAPCSSLAKDTHMSLDQLPVSIAYNPKTPIGADTYSKEQSDFVQGVAAQAKAKGYVVTQQRVFVFVGYVPEIGPQWVVLHAELNNQLSDTYHAEEIAKEVSADEPVASSFWRLSDGQVIAVAQSQPLPDGKALVGYFSLTE